MIGDNEVLDYIKFNLGSPFLKLEMDDEEILKYIKKYTLKTFSKYLPDTNKIELDLGDPNNVFPEEENAFYLFEKDGLEILNVKDVYYSLGGEIIFGHPIMGAYSFGEIPSLVLAMEENNITKLFSDFDFHFFFKAPNVLYIRPIPQTQTVVVEYERVHPPDFSTIPVDMEEDFLDLALADIKIIIGQRRKRYNGTIRTPFGEIPLDVGILDEGRDERDKLITKFEQFSYPNVIFDKG